MERSGGIRLTKLWADTFINEHELARSSMGSRAFVAPSSAASYIDHLGCREMVLLRQVSAAALPRASFDAEGQLAVQRDAKARV